MEIINKNEIEFCVRGIYCQNCVIKLKRALSILPNVIEVEIIPDFTHASAKVRVKYYRDINKSEIEDVIKEISMETLYHDYQVVW